jgi:hypothetical protein
MEGFVAGSRSGRRGFAVAGMSKISGHALVCPILRHPQPQGVNSDDQRTAVIAGALRQLSLLRSPLAVPSPQSSPPRAPAGQRFDGGTHEIFTQREQSFAVDNFRFTLRPNHGVHPSRVGDVEHYQHASDPSGIPP